MTDGLKSHSNPTGKCAKYRHEQMASNTVSFEIKILGCSFKIADKKKTYKLMVIHTAGRKDGTDISLFVG